jgi:DNA-binding NarL/FixJ family response regulator
VHAQTFFRAGVKLALEPYSSLRIVGEVANVREALKEARIVNPRVILLDSILVDRAESIAALRKSQPRPFIVVFTTAPQRHQDKPVVIEGADRCILKTAGPAELLQVLLKLPLETEEMDKVHAAH